MVWRAPDPVPVVEANREVVPERVGVEVQSHVVEALEDDLDQEREEVPVDSRSAAGIPVRNRFSVLESTVGDTECLMSTVVDGSSGNVDVFPMTDDAAGHVPRDPRVQLDRRRMLVQDTPQSEGEVAAVPRVVDHGEWDRPLHDTESLSSQGFSTDIDGQSEVSGAEEAESEVEPDPPFRMPGVATLRAAFLLLAQVNLADEMKERASVMTNFFEVLTESQCGQHWKRFAEVIGVKRWFVRRGVGSSSSFFQECCCTGQQEGASFHDRNWRAGLSRS